MTKQEKEYQIGLINKEIRAIFKQLDEGFSTVELIQKRIQLSVLQQQKIILRAIPDGTRESNERIFATINFKK